MFNENNGVFDMKTDRIVLVLIDLGGNVEGVYSTVSLLSKRLDVPSRALQWLMREVGDLRIHGYSVQSRPYYRHEYGEKGVEKDEKGKFSAKIKKDAVKIEEDMDVFVSDNGFVKRDDDAVAMVGDEEVDENTGEITKNNGVLSKTSGVGQENIPAWFDGLGLVEEEPIITGRVVMAEMKDWGEIDPTDPPLDVDECERNQRKHKQTRNKKGDNMYVECKTCNHKFNYYMP